jgi:hypothetical protein
MSSSNDELVTVEVTVPKAMVSSLKNLSGKRMIDSDVLLRLALFDFLVKFNNFKGSDEERERYEFLYEHFSIDPAERVLAAERKKLEAMDYAI